MALAFGAIKMIVLRSFGFFFAFTFECGTDLAHYWTSAQAIEQYCVDTNALDVGFVVSNVLTDLLILAIPIPIV